MIYIDPPYNTGKDFVYKDNFRANIENYKKVTGQVSEEGTKLTTNTDTDGRYHSNWLNMMYPRLKLARNLLTDDGVIFISIDDNEQANLKKICDEIFGEENFVAQIAWRKSDNQANIGNIARVKEYILSYSKNDKLFYLNKMKLTEKAKKEYRYKDDRGFFRRSILLHKTRGRYKYDLKTPTGKILSGPWMKSKEDIEKMSNEGMIYWTTGGEEQPYGKIYLDESDGQIPNDFIGIEYGSNQEASLELEKLMQSRYFDFPKSVTLLKHLAKIGSNLDNYILDFFSGSATTAHSVIQLNAEDGGNRKYIMVQLPELCDEDSEAYKAGYKNICEIGKERIRRAGEKIKSDESLPLENRERLDIGFKVFKLDSSNIKEWDTKTEDLQQTLLDSMENIKSDRNSLDVLYEILLKYGLDLNIPIEENKDFYSIGGGSLLVSLNKEINDEVINSIYEEYKKLLEIDKEFKTTVILRDNSFKNDVDKTNAIKKLEQVGINEIRSI
ncbi:site-specific DNA-methyltransferase [Fusobacterium hwasookii]|uniref:site-specific DNA-methyltransferase n=3 Tax=Fusobacterium hwasookii TaxID=1583098 RepID=UPI001625695F|nr:site-specific DNA-methyltransferase [Fusobacterium hwasookii]QNE69417.1 site-specific DNA-methyltransferase [Fusobacterium hwasookii]